MEPLSTRAPLSFQSWGMKDQLRKDFDGTLKAVRESGFDGVEMCSPFGFRPFKFLKSLGAGELRKRIESAGLFCRTCHFAAGELLGSNVGDSIEYGTRLGLQNLTMGSARMRRRATLDDWKAFAEKANASGETIRKAGLQLVYHNHSIGPEYDGTPLYDHLMQLFDPDLVKMQFQLASIADGYDIIAYLDKYSDRYVALHLHDWDPNKKSMVPIGDGVIDWQKLMTTARKSNIADHGWIIEIETAKPFEGLVRSHDYLSKLRG